MPISDTRSKAISCSCQCRETPILPTDNGCSKSSVLNFVTIHRAASHAQRLRSSFCPHHVSQLLECVFHTKAGDDIHSSILTSENLTIAKFLSRLSFCIISLDGLCMHRRPHQYDTAHCPPKVLPFHAGWYGAPVLGHHILLRNEVFINRNGLRVLSMVTKGIEKEDRTCVRNQLVILSCPCSLDAYFVVIRHYVISVVTICRFNISDTAER